MVGMCVDMALLFAGSSIESFSVGLEQTGSWELPIDLMQRKETAIQINVPPCTI
jgi:hypothetical protein